MSTHSIPPLTFCQTCYNESQTVQNNNFDKRVRLNAAALALLNNSTALDECHFGHKISPRPSTIIDRSLEERINIIKALTKKHLEKNNFTKAKVCFDEFCRLNNTNADEILDTNIKWHLDNSNLDEALLVFKRATQFSLMPACSNELLLACIRAQKIDSANKIMVEMKKVGFPFKEEIYIALFQMYMDRRDYVYALKTMGYIDVNGIRMDSEVRAEAEKQITEFLDIQDA